jgi:hypothetical protein
MVGAAYWGEVFETLKIVGSLAAVGFTIMSFVSIMWWLNADKSDLQKAKVTSFACLSMLFIGLVLVVLCPSKDTYLSALKEQAALEKSDAHPN